MNTSNEFSVVGTTDVSLQITNQAEAQVDPVLYLDFATTYLRNIKAVKKHIDPLSECMGGVVGVACCCLMAFAQAEENSRPATRHDVLYAERERRRDRRELGTSFELGYCLGDFVVDTASVSLGSLICFFPSLYRSQCNPLLSTDPICGISANELDETALFDSCASRR